jgi:hypothetical protein
MRQRTKVLHLVVLLLVGALGCQMTRPFREPPPPDIQPTLIDYADTDAFDVLLESALTNQDPIIVVQTEYQKPDWGPRLNAWIAAWNLGGRVEDVSARGTVRFQAPIPSVVVDGDSIREFRLLIESLMNRAEELARTGSNWWAEEKVRARRIELLRPYNLRFHQGADRNIQIILFNGRYGQHYRTFMRSFANPATNDVEEWSRTFGCSQCKQVSSSVVRKSSSR